VDEIPSGRSCPLNISDQHTVMDGCPSCPAILCLKIVSSWEFRRHQKARFLSSQMIFNFRADYVQVFSHTVKCQTSTTQISRPQTHPKHASNFSPTQLSSFPIPSSISISHRHSIQDLHSIPMSSAPQTGGSSEGSAAGISIPNRIFGREY